MLPGLDSTSDLGRAVNAGDVWSCWLTFTPAVQVVGGLRQPQIARASNCTPRLQESGRSVRLVYEDASPLGLSGLWERALTDFRFQFRRRKRLATPKETI